jgi:hypothetical protein
LQSDRDKVAIAIAEKKLSLFDLQGEEESCPTKSAHAQVPDDQGPRVVRRWNLNEGEGRYAATNVVESLIELHLGLKRADGSRQAVGRFHLDLNTLADDGFVTRRVVDGNRVFDIQIYREGDGSYSLGVRQNDKTSLAPYLMP